MKLLSALLAAFSVVVWIILFFHPVNSFLLRLGLLCSMCGMLLGVIFLTRHKTMFRRMFFVALVAGAVFMLLPEREIDARELRMRYLVQLRGYEGTPYHWGGENRLGIDCSGLMRKSLQNACLLYGLRHVDGAMVRKALGVWWNDVSAKSLGAGAEGETQFVFSTASIARMGGKHVRPGDMAVDQKGRHVLAYLGDEDWIQASKMLGEVVILPTTASNHWHHRPMKVVRWRCFAQIVGGSE